MQSKTDNGGDMEERMRALELAITQIDRQFGKGAIMRMGDREVVNDTFNIGAKEFETMREDFQAVLVGQGLEDFDELFLIHGITFR